MPDCALTALGDPSQGDLDAHDVRALIGGTMADEHRRLIELVAWIDAHSCHDCRRHEGCAAWHATNRQLAELLGKLDCGDVVRANAEGTTDS